MSVTQRTCPGCKQQGPLGNPRPGTVQLVWGRGGPAPGRHPSGDQALGVGEGHRPCSQDHALGRGTAPSEPRRDPPPAVGPSAATGVPGREAWLRAGLRLGSRPPGWNRGSLSPNRGLWVSPSFSSWKKAQDRVLGPLLTSHRELVSDLAPPSLPGAPSLDGAARSGCHRLRRPHSLQPGLGGTGRPAIKHEVCGGEDGRAPPALEEAAPGCRRRGATARARGTCAHRTLSRPDRLRAATPPPTVCSRPHFLRRLLCALRGSEGFPRGRGAVLWICASANSNGIIAGNYGACNKAVRVW